MFVSKERERGRGGEGEIFCAAQNRRFPRRPLSPSLPRSMATLIVFVAMAGRLNAAPPPAARPWVGVSSCSAQPCHGDVARDNVWPVWGNEVTIWIERDPHAQAYRVLSNELSKKMAQRLQLAVSANQSQQCLKCHSPADAFELRTTEPRLADGVGCESCHGPAREWLTQHTQKGWRNKTPQAKRELGLFDTTNLHARATACAACHVGAPAADGLPGGDVNHDLIAAGHPALKFEFTAYLAKVPKHWSEKSPGMGFEARAWAVGQAACAAASLRLLANRADAGREKAWPEFAEYDCFSCHHQLYGPTQDDRRKPRRNEPPGLPTWGTWYFSLVSALPDIGKRLETVADIERLMQRPGGDRASLLQTAGQAAERFDDLADRLESYKYSSAAVESLLARLKDSASRASGSSWDGEVQLYLALVALHYAKHDSQGVPLVDDALTRSLHTAREQLMFPISADGRRRFDSPRGFDLQATLREQLLPDLDRLLKE
jgi:hypothetical protein